MQKLGYHIGSVENVIVTRVVGAHAIKRADPGSIPTGGPLLHVTSPSLSHVSSLSTANKGVYATKSLEKRKCNDKIAYI